mmetsp:Transcript_19385/g.57886  ORF Transcript_19385/g.57886 Transcript_19385/m.57886 type:complete len:1076 (-) Transcript_19385:309-3536(-)
MRAAALLDALVGGPRQLERDVQPLARVRHAPVRLQRDARRGRLRDDGDELAAVHEGLLLREVDALHRHHPPRVGVHLVRVPLLVDGAPLLVAHEPPLATRELGDRLGAAELLDELVERVVGHLERVQLAHELLLEPLQHLDLGRIAVLRPAEVLLLLLRLGQQVVVRPVALAPLGLGLRRRLGRRRQRRLGAARAVGRARHLLLVLVAGAAAPGGVRVVGGHAPRLASALARLAFARPLRRRVLRRARARRLEQVLRVRVLHRPPRAARPRRRLLAVVVPLDLLEQHPVLGAAAAVSVAHAVVAGARVVRHDGGHAAAAPLLLDRELLADEVVAGLRLAHLDVLLLLLLLLGRELDVALLLRAALQPPLGPARRLSRVGRGPLAAAEARLREEVGDALPAAAARLPLHLLELLHQLGAAGALLVVHLGRAQQLAQLARRHLLAGGGQPHLLAVTLLIVRRLVVLVLALLLLPVPHDEAVEVVVLIIRALLVAAASAIREPAAPLDRRPGDLACVDPRCRARHLSRQVVVVRLVAVVEVRLWVLVGVVAGGELLEQEADALLHPGELLQVLARLDRVVEPRLARGLQPHHHALVVCERPLGHLDQLGHLHRHAERAEEALVAAPVVADHARGRVRLRLARRRVRRPLDLLQVEHLVHGVVERAEQLRPEGRRLVVHLLLPRREVDHLGVEGGGREGELPAEVHAPPLEVERDQLHRADAAAADGLVEGVEVGKGGVGAPQAEPLHVGHVLQRRGARGGAVHDARARAVGLQLLAGEGHLGRLFGGRLALFVLLWREVLGLVRLVKEDAALGLGAAEPLGDLRGARLAAALARDERGVGCEDDALADPLGPLLVELAVVELGDVLHLDVREADVLEVALGVLHQVGRDGDPQVALATAQPVLDDHAGELPPLAEADAVAEEEAGAAAVGHDRLVPLARVRDRLELEVGERSSGGVVELVARLEDAVGQVEVVLDRRRLREGERGRLDHRVRVRLAALEVEGLVRRGEHILGVLVLDRRLLPHLRRRLLVLRHVLLAVLLVGRLGKRAPHLVGGARHVPSLGALAPRLLRALALLALL